MSATANPTVESIDPATGEVVETYEIFGEGKIDAALDGVHAAFESHRRDPWEKRAELMAAVARELRAAGDELADTVSREMGKPIAEARAEVEKCAGRDYYAEHGGEFLAPEQVDAGEGRTVRLRYRPLGIVLAMMPWNFPFWQAMRAAVPAPEAGNAVLLKHAANVTGCGLRSSRPSARRDCRAASSGRSWSRAARRQS